MLLDYAAETKLLAARRTIKAIRSMKDLPQHVANLALALHSEIISLVGSINNEIRLIKQRRIAKAEEALASKRDKLESMVQALEKAKALAAAANQNSENSNHIHSNHINNTNTNNHSNQPGCLTEEESEPEPGAKGPKLNNHNNNTISLNNNPTPVSDPSQKSGFDSTKSNPSGLSSINNSNVLNSSSSNNNNNNTNSNPNSDVVARLAKLSAALKSRSANNVNNSNSSKAKEIPLTSAPGGGSSIISNSSNSEVPLPPPLSPSLVPTPIPKVLSPIPFKGEVSLSSQDNEAEAEAPPTPPPFTPSANSTIPIPPPLTNDSYNNNNNIPAAPSLEEISSSPPPPPFTPSGKLKQNNLDSTNSSRKVERSQSASALTLNDEILNAVNKSKLRKNSTTNTSNPPPIQENKNLDVRAQTLEQITSGIKLKATGILRSPGGTPISRPPSNSLTLTQTDVLRAALDNKFKNVNGNRLSGSDDKWE